MNSTWPRAGIETGWSNVASSGSGVEADAGSPLDRRGTLQCRVAVMGVVEDLERGRPLREVWQVPEPLGAEEPLVEGVVEVLHDGVAPGLTERDQSDACPERQTHAHRQREMPPATGDRLAVVELSHLRHNCVRGIRRDRKGRRR